MDIKTYDEQLMKVKEYHGEVDEPPYYETVTETYCPNCDIYTGDYYV